MMSLRHNSNNIRLSKDELLVIIRGVLHEHVLDNLEGTFRWVPDIYATAECVKFRLTFVQSIFILGFKLPCKSDITLFVDNRREPYEALFLTWQIESRNAHVLCQIVVKETDLAIREALAF